MTQDSEKKDGGALERFRKFVAGRGSGIPFVAWDDAEAVLHSYDELERSADRFLAAGDAYATDSESSDAALMLEYAAAKESLCAALSSSRKTGDGL
ncbi:hypothetical protein ABLE91_05585 [Aquabacter sp. CN5-332]|uniref:hypothetical protein n=1 Tax=Aquabacter sp. CN5-332 TaxID=3156608 RepID=UPI0032B4611B